MKALSIRQPWAWLIVHAGKDIENRNWNTSYRGFFYIHAAKGLTSNEYVEACDWVKHNVDPEIVIPGMRELQRGGIIGKAKIIESARSHPSKWFIGQFGFVLRNVKPIEFQEVKGQLNFFNVEIDEKEKERTRRQIMGTRAKQMKGKRVSFRSQPKHDDPDERRKRVYGTVVSAKIGDFHEVAKLLGYEVVVRGKSGREVTIDSNETFMKIYWLD